jgi:hypothetical protein
MTTFAIQRVTATPSALALIERLIEKHGPVAFLQSGACADWTPATCLTKAELLPNLGEVKLGEIGGCPFYVDREAYERSGRPVLVVDVAEGAGGEFSLEGLEDAYFVCRAPYESVVGD